MSVSVKDEAGSTDDKAKLKTYNFNANIEGIINQKELDKQHEFDDQVATSKKSGPVKLIKSCSKLQSPAAFR